MAAAPFLKMAKITAQEIIDLGFIKEMFKYEKKTDAEFNSFVDSVIALQALSLEGRIGSTAYALATSPMKDYVKRAELCLSAAEMWQRRINILLSSVPASAEGVNTKAEREQRQAYLDEVNGLVEKIVAGATADSSSFASGVLTTSHFEVST